MLRVLKNLIKTYGEYQISIQDLVAQAYELGEDDGYARGYEAAEDYYRENL